MPSGVSSAIFDVFGAQGGEAGGKGGEVAATLAVTAGETLDVAVGQAGIGGCPGSTHTFSATAFGGGAAARCGFEGPGGGGASRVTRSSTSLLVAGGGGGLFSDGGVGGNTTGGDGGPSSATDWNGQGGKGGTGSAGGAAGDQALGSPPGSPPAGYTTCFTHDPGQPGTSGVGGVGGEGGSGFGGGGGGGGYYGGGGGGGGAYCTTATGHAEFGFAGAGGGGSSFAEGAASGVTGVTMNAGVRAGNGVVTVMFSSPDSDGNVPQVTIDQASGQADPTGTSPIHYTAVFSEPVTGFTSAGVSPSGSAGGTKTVMVTEVAPMDGTTYDVAVSGMTTAGTVIAMIPAGVATGADFSTNGASTSSDNIVTYDVTPPDITLSVDAADSVAPSGWYNIASSGTDGVLVHVAASDQTAVTNITCTDGLTEVLNTSSASGSFTLSDGDHSISCTASDGINPSGAGPNSTPMPVELKVDETAPQTELTPMGTLGLGGWYTSPVHVAVSASDPGGSGVAETRCQLDGTAPSSFADMPVCPAAGLDATGDGTHTAYAASKDAAGNVAMVESVGFKIDQTPPVTTLMLDPAVPDVNGWYVFAVKPTASATDTGSGLATTRCQLDGSPPASYDDLPAGTCAYLAPSSWVVTEGIHTLYAASIDNAGNEESIQTIVFKIDKTAPVSQVTPLNAFQTGASFPVAWSAIDTLSGVASYSIRYRQAPSNGSFGSYTTWFSHTTSASAMFTAPAGTTTCFSARATDVAGWTPFAWSAEQCTTVPLDDPALSRIGFWTTVSGAGYYGPSVTRSTSTGNRLTASMRGQTIGVLVTKQPGGATIELRWNGSTKLTTSLNAASIQKKQLLTFMLPGVQSGTLEIVQTGYGTVDIDGAGANKTS